MTKHRNREFDEDHWDHYNECHMDMYHYLREGDYETVIAFFKAGIRLDEWDIQALEDSECDTELAYYYRMVKLNNYKK